MNELNTTNSQIPVLFVDIVSYLKFALNMHLYDTLDSQNNKNDI